MDAGILTLGGSLLDVLPAQVGLPGSGGAVFFREINSFIDDELIHEYLPNLGQRVVQILGGIGILVLTLWIMIQGFRIVTGQSRESMMALVVNALRATFIVGIALGIGASFGPIYGTVTDGLTRVINETMTGEASGEGPYEDIDTTLAILEGALAIIDAVDTTYDEESRDQKTRALMMTSAGLGLPAISAAAAILLNKFAIGLVLALGPLFILCLLFEQTKPLFQKWLLYGIGAIFSLGVLTVTVTLALDMVIAVGAAFWLTSLIPSVGGGENLMTMAMQQGGLGLILTTLIVSTPPIAAMLFQGTLGQFSPYNAYQQQPQVGSPGNPGGVMSSHYATAPMATGSTGPQAGAGVLGGNKYG